MVVGRGKTRAQVSRVSFGLGWLQARACSQPLSLAGVSFFFGFSVPLLHWTAEGEIMILERVITTSKNEKVHFALRLSSNFAVSRGE